MTASLTHEQLLAMFGLKARKQQQQQQSCSSGSASDDKDGASSSVASTRVFEEITGLSEEQIEGLTELESFIKVAERNQNRMELDQNTNYCLNLVVTGSISSNSRSISNGTEEFSSVDPDW